MRHFAQSPSWKALAQWLDSLQGWAKRMEDVPRDLANEMLAPNPQAWFKSGVDALNGCLQPSNVGFLRQALEVRPGNMDAVYEHLKLQDMAWHPNPATLDCISGHEIWLRAMVTMAYRTDWDLESTQFQEALLQCFLRGRSHFCAEPQAMPWFKRICFNASWAQTIAFDWCSAREIPANLHWAVQGEDRPNRKSMLLLCSLHAFKNEPSTILAWTQLQELRPDLTDYITRSVETRQQLMGATLPLDAAFGQLLAQNWQAPSCQHPSIDPGLFEA